MAKNLRISVPEPCHENWQQMTPADKGRHCKSCDKVVVDFSRMTDAQVVDHFKNYQGKTCGRFKAEQLNRPMSLSVGQRLFRPIKYIAASLLAIEVFSQKARARDVIDIVSLQTVQTDTAVATSVADSLMVTDSCTIAVVDSCAEDLQQLDSNWTVGDVVSPSRGSIVFLQEFIVYGNSFPTMGICSPAPEMELIDYRNKAPIIRSWIKRYVYINVWPFKKWNEQKVPTHFINQAAEKQSKKDRRPRHFSFAALVRRLKLMKG